MAQDPTFKSFAEFYPYYLAEHSKRANRLFHLVGFIFVPLAIWVAWTTQNILWILAGTLAVYTCGGLGHTMIEGNKPTTRKWPVYSFFAYFKMIFEIATGRITLGQ